jgi:hypothetical protein
MTKTNNADMLTLVVDTPPAGWAETTAYAGENLYPVAGLEHVSRGAALNHHPGDFMPQYAWVVHIPVTALEHLYIGTADGTCLSFHNKTAIWA